MRSSSKRMSRVLGALMSVVLTVGLLPATAFAEVGPDAAVTGKTFKQTTTLSDGEYVFVSTGKALDQTVSDTHTANSGGTYVYDGFDGESVTVAGGEITSAVSEDMIWKVEKVSGGYTIKSTSAEGEAVYLSGSYTKKSSETHGVLELSKNACVWTFENGTLAASTDQGKKYISNDDSQYQNRFDFFTMRSNGSTFTLYKVEDASGSGENPGQGGGEEEGEQGGSTDPKAISISSSKTGVTGSASIEVGQTLVITLTNGSSTNSKNFTTEVEDASVAKVTSGGSQSIAKNASGKIEVVGLKAGETDIVMTGTGSGNPYIATIALTVTGSGTGHKHADADGKWESNASQHYRTCTCGETFDAANHSFKNGVCSTCNATDPNYVAPSGDATYVAFSSDVHNSSSSKTGGSAGRLNNWINNVSGVVGSSFATMAFCGDTGSANVSGSTFWNYVQVVMDVVSENSNVADDGVFINGNHEFQNGSQGSTSNATAQKVKGIGDVVSGSDYLVYVFGARSTSQGFNSSDITALGNWLNSTPAGKPIFVVSHFPLHKNGSRDSENKASVISTLNAYSDKHEIYFLWGHNHTNSDSKYDDFITGSLDGTQIGFTYMAAGCMSDSEYSSGSAYVKGKGLVAKIQDGTVTSLAYYAENGTVVNSYTPQQSDAPSVDPGNPDYEGKVVIVGNGYALTTAAGESYSNTGSSSSQKYNYTGLAGKKYTEGMTLTDDMLWETEDAGNGYIYIKHGNQYLNGSYASNSTGGYDGALSLGAKSDKWIWEDNLLKSYNASQTDKGAKYLTHGNSTQSGSNVNTFTVRSLDYANSSTTFIEVKTEADHTHSGGTATCKDKAVCSTCGEAYGSLNASNHAGGTEVRNAVAATCSENGYTGDTYCLGCGVKTASGQTVAATGAHVDADGKWESDGAQHYRTCGCGEKFDAANHAGGTATCKDKAVCSICGAAYGNLNASVHDGGTEVRDAIAATCGEAGYTGDTYCKGCGVKIASGEVVAATGEHDFEGGVCTECGAEDADYKNLAKLTAEVAKATYTGSEQQVVLSIVDGGVALVEGVDYIVEAEPQTNAGTYEFRVVGAGEYVGEIAGEWTIAPADIASVEGLSITDKFISNGSFLKPELSLTFDGQTLVLGTDYEVEYANNVNPGMATATVSGIGNFAGEAEVSFEILPQGKWVQDPTGWKYRNPDGSYASNGWQEIDGVRYHFGSDSYMDTGWVFDGGEWYYLKSSGAMAASEWAYYGGEWYYLAADGAMATGWLYYGGEWYYLASDGSMQTGWLYTGGNWRYLKSSGAMATGWVYDGGAWYYLNPANDGVMATGWVYDGGSWYYLYSSGKMASSCWIGDYYLLASGKMATSQWIGAYYVGADGKWVPGYTR